MSPQLRRPLAIVTLVLLVGIAVMAIVGWLIAAASHSPGRTGFSVTVLNDRSESLTIQPCSRFFCNEFQPLEIAPGTSHTWQTTDADAGIHSFVVEAAPRGRILGCMSARPESGGQSPVIRVSDLERCVTS
jgi:hypothetical protein